MADIPEHWQHRPCLYKNSGFCKRHWNNIFLSALIFFCSKEQRNALLCICCIMDIKRIIRRWCFMQMEQKRMIPALTAGRHIGKRGIHLTDGTELTVTMPFPKAIHSDGDRSFCKGRDDAANVPECLPYQKAGAYHPASVSGTVGRR